MGNFTPSTYQVEIDRVFTQETCNILIGAVAGSGKTTTLLSLLKKVRGTGIYLAFNKSIVTELQEKVGYIPRIEFMTLHSLGMKALLRKFGRVKMNDNKSVDFCEQFFRSWGFHQKNKDWWVLVYTIKELYGLYRMKLCRNEFDLMEVCDNLGIEYDSQLISKVLQIHKVATIYNQRPKEIDFTDMIYLTATDKRVQLSNPDVTFIDEAQDLNEAQHLLIDKLVGKKRFVACGDRNQSIYSFAGSDMKSFDKFLEKPNVRELPLSVCYRCGKDIVEHANKVYDVMESFQYNQRGVIERDSDVLDVEEGEMVICRNTQPLINVYFLLLKINKKAFVKGKDIGKNLINLINKFRVEWSEELVEKLYDKLDEIGKELQDRGVENYFTHPKYNAYKEKIEIIEIFTKKYDKVSKVRLVLEEMFADNENGVILSTIHKAKGLESDTVYFLESNLIPSSYAKTEEQLRQEKNLKYVAITRAKSRLIYCNSPF